MKSKDVGAASVEAAEVKAVGPTIHTVVMDKRTTELRTFAIRYVQRYATDFAGKVGDEVAELIREAYIRGVRDGFQQGALAAALTREDSSESDPSPEAGVS